MTAGGGTGTLACAFRQSQHSQECLCRLIHFALETLPERMQDVHTRSVLGTPPTMACTRRKLGFQRRLLTLWAWLILFPYAGPLPQISQANAIATPRYKMNTPSHCSRHTCDLPTSLSRRAFAGMIDSNPDCSRRRKDQAHGKRVRTEFTEAITVRVIEPLPHRLHRVIFAGVSVFSV